VLERLRRRLSGRSRRARRRGDDEFVDFGERAEEALAHERKRAGDIRMPPPPTHGGDFSSGGGGGGGF
jgi:hypothetical protein